VPEPGIEKRPASVKLAGDPADKLCVAIADSSSAIKGIWYNCQDGFSNQ
jgi:hypothetical protein